MSYYGNKISTSSFPNKVILVLRVIQIVLSVVVLALCSATIDNNTFIRGGFIYRVSSGSDRFGIFVSVWSLFAIVYLLFSPLYTPVIAYSLAFLFVETLSWIFWLSAWAALMATWADYYYCDRYSGCKTGRAAAAIALVNWIVWSISLFYVIKSAIPYFRHNGATVNAVGVPGGELPPVYPSANVAQGPVIIDNSQLEAGTAKAPENNPPIEMYQAPPGPPPQSAAAGNPPIETYQPPPVPPPQPAATSNQSR